MSEETKKKMSISALKRDNTKRINSLPRGENHHTWKKNPDHLTFHKRIYRKLGKASQHKCVDCSKQAKDWSNKKRILTQKMEDYEPRCRSCHMKYDMTDSWKKKIIKNLKRN